MTQISFDGLNEGFCSLEKKAFDMIAPVFAKMLKEDNLNPESVIFREGNSENSQYSSVCFLNEGCILCRICFRGKQQYLSISTKYESLIPDGTEYKTLASDSGFCRITLSSMDDILQFERMLCEILATQIDTVSTEFDCCSRYVECSEGLRCVHPNFDMAIKCAYRKKLKKGIVFYGENRNVD